jgi:hypothetical protein
MMNCSVLYSSILFGTLEADEVSFKKSISKFKKAGGMSFVEIRGG